jgi:outer membrane protein
MKRLLITLIALVVSSLAGAAYAADGMKIANVDYNKIAKDSKAGAEAKKTLTKLADAMGKKLKAKEAELDSIKATLEGKGKQLTAKERSAKEKEFKNKLDALRQTAQDAQKDLQAKEEEYLNKLLLDIEKAVKEYAPKNGYALVIRKGDLIYSDGRSQIVDVTDDVLKILDGAPPAAATKEAAPKEETQKK